MMIMRWTDSSATVAIGIIVEAPTNREDTSASRPTRSNTISKSQSHVVRM